jgi:hypothetical protein
VESVLSIVTEASQLSVAVGSNHSMIAPHSPGLFAISSRSCGRGELNTGSSLSSTLIVVVQVSV